MALAKSLIDFNVGKKQSEWELPPFSSCVSSSAPISISVLSILHSPALFFYELSSVHKLFNIFNDIWRQTVNYTNNIYAFSGVGFKCYISKVRLLAVAFFTSFPLKTFRYAHEVHKIFFHSILLFYLCPAFNTKRKFLYFQPISPHTLISFSPAPFSASVSPACHNRII